MNIEGELDLIIKEIVQRPTLELEDVSSVNYYKSVISRLENIRKTLSVAATEGPASSSLDELLYRSGSALRNLAHDLFRVAELSECEEPKEVFFIANRGGLCNRLRALASLRVLSKVMNFKFRFVWLESRDCTGSPYLSLETSNNVQPSENSLSFCFDVLLNKRSSCLFLNAPDNYTISSNKITKYFKFESFEVEDLNVLYEKECDVVLNEVLDSLGLRSDGQALISTFDEPYVGVHVRRTDMIDRWKRLYPDKPYPSVAEFMNRVASENKGNRFFLCTDEASVIDEFNSRFGTFCVVTPHKHFSGFRQTTLEHSVLDLYVLSRSFKIIGTAESSFSKFASIAGNSEFDNANPIVPLDQVSKHRLIQL